MTSAIDASQPRSRAFTVGVAVALASAVLFSAKAIVVKLAYRYSVDAVTLLALRMCLSMPFLIAAAWWSQRVAKPRPAPLSRADFLRIGFLGFTGYYLASFLDFLGLQYITAALERLILFTYPTVVFLNTAVLLRRPFTRMQVAALALSYVGIAIVFSHDLTNETGRNVPLGAALVLVSALIYAVYLVASGEIVRRVGTMRLTAYATIVASLLCMVQFALTHDISVLRTLAPQVWQLSMFNAVFCTVLPVFGTMIAIARVGAPTVSLTGTVGPIATIFLGAIVLGEPITLVQLVGTALVMVGVVLTTRSRAG